MRRIFWGFCRTWFLMSPLHYLSGRSDFGFEFAEIFVFEKRLPAATDTGSHRLRILVIRGVANSAYQWYGESPSPRITDTRSRQLPASLICGVGESPHHRYGESAIKRTLRQLLALVIRWVADSPYRRQYRDSTTPCIDESGSWWLPPRIGDTESRYLKKKLIWCRFSGLLTAKPCL